MVIVPVPRVTLMQGIAHVLTLGLAQVPVVNVASAPVDVPVQALLVQVQEQADHVAQVRASRKVVQVTVTAIAKNQNQNSAPTIPGR